MMKSSQVFFKTLKLVLTLLRMSRRKLGRTKSKAESCIRRAVGIKRDTDSCLSEEHSHPVTLLLPSCLSPRYLQPSIPDL